MGVLALPPQKPFAWQSFLPKTSIRNVGFTLEEALLPARARSFLGYHLLHEYFAFPQRFSFFRIEGLRQCVKQCEGNRLSLVILLDREEPQLQGRIEASNFLLHCAPVINLFPKRADTIHLSDKYTEFHVVPHRTHDMDFEVYQVLKVTGYGVLSEAKQDFKPFYLATHIE